MTREEFLAKEAAGEAVLVDIRESQELAVVPSPARALHVPLSSFTEIGSLVKIPKEKMIVTLCASGGRCGPANSFLANEGYVVDMIDGGLIGWGGGN
jgi:rhodanese-related sulfurtransferase